MKINEKKLIYMVFIVGFIFLICSSAVLGLYGRNAEEPTKIVEPPEVVDNEDDNETPVKPPVEEVEEYVTALLVGFDKGGHLTDVLMVGYLDIKDSKFKLISVPRDLEIDFRDELFADIKANNPNNKVRICKLTEIYVNLGSNERALEDLKKVIERLIDLEIEYVATVKLDAFKEIVDAVGGVWFNVPQNMTYKDPYQDLYINLKKGEQLMDGDKAEQLVRNRHYPEGDLRRVEIQREFLTALINKVLKESSMEQMLQLVNTAYAHMNSNVTFMDVIKYAKIFYNLKDTDFLSSEYMMTVPSYGELVDGNWKQYWDKSKIDEEIKALLQK